MVCAAVTSWRSRELRPRQDSVTAGGSSDPTAILDWESPEFVHAPRRGTDERDIEYLRSVHRWVQHAVRPVYGLDETRPASITLRRAQGSCSQRLAVVEACARRAGMRTRVEGIIVRGEFWYPRFGPITALVPDRVLLAWPHFHADGIWFDASEAFTCGCLLSPDEFTNSGAETLFDAAGRSRISWRPDDRPGSVDLSRFVVSELGIFDSRDQLFATYGQTLPTLLRHLAEPVLGRWSPQRTTIRR